MSQRVEKDIFARIAPMRRGANSLEGSCDDVGFAAELRGLFKNAIPRGSADIRACAKSPVHRGNGNIPSLGNLFHIW
jgi:hypothetical protein